MAIQYNLLKLQEIIQFSYGNQIINWYAANGQKLGTEYFTRVANLAVPLKATEVISKTYTENSVNQNGTVYIDDKEYNTYNGNPALTSLNKIYNAEGYAIYVNSLIPMYYYFRKDHLGNNREVWCANNNVTVQRTQYYPSGLPWVSNAEDNSSLQERKYNGKEFVEMNGYDTYDYGARGYYPAIGRFTSVDPLAEKYYSISPYVYCAGNPVNLIDPDGMDWYKDKDGTNQYNPDLNKDNQKDILGKGQSYVGETYLVKDDDGKITINYRKDGSIMYADETDAYNRMWSQANRPQNGSGGKEEYGIIKGSGVLVLPDYKKDEDNNSGAASPSSYNYNLTGSKYTDPVTGKKSSYIATIHTHQDKSNSNPNLSMYEEKGDQYEAQHRTPNKPLLVMAWNGRIYGEIRNSVNAADLQDTFANRNITLRSILHGASLIKLLTRISLPSK